MEKQENKTNREYKVVEVPTQVVQAVSNSEGKILNDSEAVAEILNKLDELKKVITN